MVFLIIPKSIFSAATQVGVIQYPNLGNFTYAYDELNRLHTVTNWLSQTTTYVYDAAGRLTSLTNFNGIVTTFGYDNANRLTSQTSTLASYQFTLDGNGNRTNTVQNEPLVPTLTPATTVPNWGRATGTV